MPRPPGLHFFLALLRTLSDPCVPLDVWRSVNVASSGHRADLGQRFKRSPLEANTLTRHSLCLGVGHACCTVCGARKQKKGR